MCSSLGRGFKCYSRSWGQCSEMYRPPDVPGDKAGNRVATLDGSMQRVWIEVVAILPRDDFVGIQSRSSGRRAFLSHPATALSSPNSARKPNLPDSSHPTSRSPFRCEDCSQYETNLIARHRELCQAKRGELCVSERRLSQLRFRDPVSLSRDLWIFCLFDISLS